jgi:hypothetical protein
VTREEFGCVMAYVSAAVNKPVAENTARVYFDLLGDLPAPALEAAAKQALLESAYPTLPPVGTLRRLAVEALCAKDALPSPEEAWELTRRALVAYGYCREEQGLASLPDGPVRRAAECLGWQSLCESTEPEIVRAQYRKAYESLAGRAQRQRLLPAPLVGLLESVGGMEPANGFDRRNAWQVVQDEAKRRRLRIHDAGA